MWIRRNRALYGDDIAQHEITPRDMFENCRRALRSIGAFAATGLAGASGREHATLTSPDAKGRMLAATTNAKFVATDKPMPFKDITSYNNFYEFGTDKGDPVEHAGTLRPRPWKVSVEGAIKNPKDLRHRRSAEARAARRTRLPAALRRRLVDGDSVDRRRCRNSSSARSRPAMRNTCSSSRSPIRRRCPDSRRRFSTGRIPKACAWTKR